MVRFFDYSMFHGKSEPVGSTFIRVDQLLKYWPEAARYKYGENPEVLIFQKVIIAEDYQFPAHFEGITILDICDPMWLEGVNIVEMCHAMDAVTCPTEALADYLRQFHSNVVVVPDRFDLEVLPAPRQHSGRAKTVVWFGYAHNAELLRPALDVIDTLGLNLIIISNEDPLLHRFSQRAKESWYTYVKETDLYPTRIYEELQKADFAVLPAGYRPIDVFKSNNKTVKANLAGLPVAKTKEDVERYMDGKERQDWLDSNYAIIAKEYDVRNSVEQMQRLIQEIRINGRLQG